jgi:phosphoribosylglycinamide formyltransferase-1
VPQRAAKRLRVAVLVSGSGTNLQSVLDHCAAGTVEAEVVLVFANKRGATALERARRHGVPTEVLESSGMAREEYDARAAAVIDRYSPELLVLAGYMRILTSALIDHYPDRIINIHPALLPSFPGLRAQKQALDSGVRVTGCTTHFVRAEVDAGPVILQEAVPVEPGDTEETLTRRILEREHELLPRSIQLFAEGRLKVEGRHVHVLPAAHQP